MLPLTHALLIFRPTVSAQLESELPSGPRQPLVSPVVATETAFVPARIAGSRQPRLTRSLISIQALLGVGAYFSLGVPYLRRTHGLSRLDTSKRYLFVCNHVSLLDTILLGGL